MQNSTRSWWQASPWPRLGLVVICALIFAGMAAGRATRISADDSCDTTEDIACIQIPADQSPAPQPGVTGGASSEAAAGAPLPAAVAVPAYPPCNPPDPYGPPIPSYCSTCPPYPYPVAPATPNVPAVPVPAPVPTCGFPYRAIYTTINYANAADARSLRTLSTQGLNTYWRGDALATLRGQVADLQSRDDYATARLYSIMVQSSSMNSSSSATVDTMEHWLYQERSLDDGSVVTSLDEWVANEYDLVRTGASWYITGNTATQVSSPYPYPLTGGG